MRSHSCRLICFLLLISGADRRKTVETRFPPLLHPPWFPSPHTSNTTRVLCPSSAGPKPSSSFHSLSTCTKCTQCTCGAALLPRGARACRRVATGKGAPFLLCSCAEP